MACGFDNPNIKSFTGDGAAFLENTEEKFDIIITDASDPVVAEEGAETGVEAPANTLFNDEYYGKMKAKLRPGGILCCQDTNFREPLTKWTENDVENYKLEYYCEEMHKVSFVLPPFMKKIIEVKFF
ncbi:Spermidine synthase [Armadillidium vulgare]|nr:Spermidine synthase [Armadillidium vulgare]